MPKTPNYIKEFIEEADLPSNTKFLGFVVHLPETDEFLKRAVYGKGFENREWASIPDLAKIYKVEKKAENEVKNYGENATVACLLDTGNQYVLAHKDM